MTVTTVERIEDVEQPPTDATYVIIDVLRFSTTATILLDRGATSVRALRSVRQGKQYKERTGAMLAGEIDGETPDGFDMNNSPAAAEEIDIGGYSVGMLTSNGTRAIHALPGQDLVLGSTVNARAVADHLRDLDDDIVLLACGHKGDVADEDLVGAELIGMYLRGEEPEDAEVNTFRQRIAGSDHAERVRERGYTADVTLAQRFDTYETVPTLQGDVFRS